MCRTLVRGSVTLLAVAGLGIGLHVAVRPRALSGTALRQALSAGGRAAGMPRPALMGGEWAGIVAVHEAGLRQDEGARDRIKTALRHPRREVRVAALWALGRVGKLDDLPEVEALTDTGDDLPVTPLARVVAARIRAEGAGRARDGAALGSQMREVAEEVGLPSDQTMGQLLAVGGTAGLENKVLVREVLVQLGDMAMVAANNGVSRPAAASPLTLGNHPMAELQAEFSEHAPSLRIDALIDRILRARVGTEREDRLMQLLVDEGPAAGQAIVRQLSVMRNWPVQGTGDHVPFALLFRALRGTGGPGAAEAVAFYRGYPGWIAYYANQVYPDLVSEQRRYRVVDYANDYLY